MTFTATDIKALRRRLALTQEAFAHVLAVTVSTVNRWEQGHATPSKLAVLRLEQVAAGKGVAA